MEDSLLDMGVGCCNNSDQHGTSESLRKLEYAGSTGALNGAMPSKQTAFNKAHASSAKTMPIPSTLVWGSKYLKSKLTKGLANESCVDKCNDEVKNSPRSVAHQHFAQQQQQQQQQRPHPESLTMNSLLDDSIDDTDIVTTSQVPPGECGDTTCSESRCSTPTPTPEDALALEVGHNAHEYLEECFYTEAAVLSRERFNAIPQVHKSDFEVKVSETPGCHMSLIVSIIVTS